MGFDEIVDNFVYKSLRALDFVRKYRLSGMLQNQGPIAGEINNSHQIRRFGDIALNRPWYIKISENRL